MTDSYIIPVSRGGTASDSQWKRSLSKPSPPDTASTIDYSGADIIIGRPQKQTFSTKVWNYGKLLFHHLKVHAGMGLMCSVAYFDPGNWGVDLQAGAEFGYKLLAVVLFASIMSVVFQVMAGKLGCVTGLDLATHCRLLLHSRTKHSKFYKYYVLYPLYVLCETAIIATELAELIGSATAISLLFPSIPLWAGVLITSADVLVVLALGDVAKGGGPSRTLELIVGALVVTVFGSLIAVVIKVSPDWGPVFDGFIPSKTIFQSGGLYTSVGIIGATVMPHGLFLGSALSTQGRALQSELYEPDSFEVDASRFSTHHTGIFGFLYKQFWLPVRYMFKVDRTTHGPDMSKGHQGWPNNSYEFVKAHFWHGVIDVIGSLLGFAVIINATILIIAGAVFYGQPGADDVGLFQASDVIGSTVGRAMSILFAISLLCAGQSASITATMAGQVVTEGFWQWRISPVLRRLLARLLGLIPSLIIAVIIGPNGINALLVASQVALSVVLPFVAGPLVYFTSNKKIMRVKNPNYRPSISRPETPDDDKPSFEHKDNKDDSTEERVEHSLPAHNEPEYFDYSNHWIVTAFGYLFWFIMLVANAYVLVELMMGNE